MNRKFRFAVIFVIFSLITASVVAQDMVSRYLENINKSMILNDYEKAYGYAKFIIGYYEGEEMPEDAQTAVKDVLDKRARNLEDNKLYDDLLKMETEIEKAPSKVKRTALACIENAKDSIKKAEEEQQRMIEELKAKEKSDASKAEKEAELEKFTLLIEQQAELSKQQQELQSKRDEQMQEALTRINESNNEATKSTNTTMMWIFIIGAIVFLLVVVLIVFIVLVGYKSNRQSQEQMQSTILTMQAMRLATPVMTGLPGFMGAGAGGSKTMLLNAAVPEDEVIQAAPAGFEGAEEAEVVEQSAVDEKAKEELVGLINTCTQYGEQIDTATGRKNLSKRVAELVYKISLALGFDEFQSTLFYAASLVYDIGFLGIDASVLKQDKVSNEQFEIIKTHAVCGANMVFFADEEYRSIFKDAAGKHHENLDGTGYPLGLKADDIPYIARVLHVVESYIAQISRRAYNSNISDRDEAIEELKKMNGKYDEKIVAALDQVV